MLTLSTNKVDQLIKKKKEIIRAPNLCSSEHYRLFKNRSKVQTNNISLILSVNYWNDCIKSDHCKHLLLFVIAYTSTLYMYIYSLFKRHLNPLLKGVTRNYQFNGIFNKISVNYQIEDLRA